MPEDQCTVLTPRQQLKRVAHVGWTGSAWDWQRMDMLGEWLHLHNLPRVSAHNADRIDLSNGRDFLAESEAYDVVILHHLYIGDSESPGGSYAVSPLQSPIAWVNRLCLTGAQFIFALGDWTEVGSSYLGDIPGYALSVPTFGFAVYQRKD